MFQYILNYLWYNSMQEKLWFTAKDYTIGNWMILNAVYELWNIFPKRSTVPKTFVIVGKSSEVFGNLRLNSGILSSAIFDLKPRMTVGSHSESSYFFRHLRCNLQSSLDIFRSAFQIAEIVKNNFIIYYIIIITISFKSNFHCPGIFLPFHFYFIHKCIW